MIMNKFTLTRETMDKLEGYSAKMETLRVMMGIVHKQVWQDVMEAEEDKLQDAIFKTGALLETLLEIVETRDTEISEIVNQIHLEKQEAIA